MAIVAAEACTIIVKTVPISTKMQYGYISHIGIVLHKSQHFRVLTQIGRVVLQIRKPHKQERETKNKFTDRLTITFLREEERNTKMLKEEGAKAAMSTLNPNAEMIHAVTVVPILAPIITPIDCDKVNNPALTKLTTITVVAEEDWISAVMSTPVSTPVTRLVVIAVRIFRKRSPANF